MDHTPASNHQGLAELAETIRTGHKAIGAAMRNALRIALDSGDALIEAQGLVPAGQWGRWLRDNCFLSTRTAQLYMQLAEHRIEIEAELERVTDLSLRAARRLIMEPKPSNKKPPPPALLNAWLQASDDEKRQLLNTVGLRKLLAVMPPAWRTDIEKHILGQHAASTSPLGERATKALRAALSHIRLKTDHDRASALASLNAIGNLLAARGLDLHDVEITIAVSAKPKMGKAKAA